ncbi:MAG: TetR/AcrR family transcriptional regulator [Sporolactobacillus sp.]
MTEDLRARRTRAEIKTHFIDLLLEKNFNNITVKDITQKAQIGRGTFYLHYKDKYDLLQTLIDEAVTAITNKFQPKHLFESGKVNPAYARTFVVEAYGYFQSHERLYRALLFNEGTPSFRYRLQQQMISKFRQELMPILQQQSNNQVAFEIMPQFASSGMIGLISWWFENDFCVPKEAIADNVVRLLIQIAYL